MFILPHLVFFFSGAPALAQGSPLVSADATLVVCPRVETCADELYWISSMGWADPGGLHTVDSIVEIDAQGWTDGVAPEQTFADALAMARGEYAAGRWSMVEAACRDGYRVLDRWGGPVAPQDQFDLSFLWGAARVERGGGLGEDIAFQQAAAVAWNRSVRLPAVRDEVVTRYYAALDELIADGTGRIALGATAPDVTYLLDGVPLGSGPLELSVLAGRHRLSANKVHSDEIWGRTVSVVPGRVAHVQARFDRLDDPDEANALLVRALASGALDPELAELLSRWCTEHAVRRLRLLMAQEVEPPAPVPAGEPPGMPIYRVRQAIFDARLREVRAGPWLP